MSHGAIALEYRWRQWRYMLTDAPRPGLLRVSGDGIQHLDDFACYASAENAFWDVLTSAMHASDDHLADMRVGRSSAAVVLDRDAGGPAHLAIRAGLGCHIAHCFDTAYEALAAWANIAEELAFLTRP
ncbi:hypothetical protein [Spirillospora sp. NPDC047279]|uniref:hypothetical protein n=1 Tax=Spirillospora sp. NPDC047279 TaxID=3155478 RepID=UPI0033F44823